MYELTSEKTEGSRTVRVYRSKIHGTEIRTHLLTTDKQKNKWWTFEDLPSLPWIRNLAANKITRLFGNDLSLADIQAKMAQQRAILRSKDAEKIDKAIAHTYEIDNLATGLADPIKQAVGLGTLYLLLNDERPDVYLQSEQSVKMTILTLDPDMHAFFLSWWQGIIERYGTGLKVISPIVSAMSL